MLPPRALSIVTSWCAQLSMRGGTRFLTCVPSRQASRFWLELKRIGQAGRHCEHFIGAKVTVRLAWADREGDLIGQ